MTMFSDPAAPYGAETKILTGVVLRNRTRFPEDFKFVGRLWRSQTVTSK